MPKWGYFIPPFLLAMLFGLHPFLALNRPVEAKVMVIEGWIPEESLKFAASLFKADHYDLIITNGGDVRLNNPENFYNTYAEMAQNKLMQMGINGNQIIAVRTLKINRSKSYSYARSTVAWLLKNMRATKAVNILTLGAHARKSYVLYKKAAGKALEIGIISAPPVKYDPTFWYFSTYGIGFVLKNFFGYLGALAIYTS